MKIKNLRDLLRETITHPFSNSVVVENNKGMRVVLREGGKYQKVDLSGANLSGVKLIDIDLSDANLSDVNLSGADLRRARLKGANLRGAIISGANLEQAIIEKQQLDKARFTIKPYGITREMLSGSEKKAKGRK